MESEKQQNNEVLKLITCGVWQLIIFQKIKKYQFTKDEKMQFTISLLGNKRTKWHKGDVLRGRLI